MNQVSTAVLYSICQISPFFSITFIRIWLLLFKRCPLTLILVIVIFTLALKSNNFGFSGGGICVLSVIISSVWSNLQRKYRERLFHITYNSSNFSSPLFNECFFFAVVAENTHSYYIEELKCKSLERVILTE